MENKISDFLYKQICAVLDGMQSDPDSVSERDKERLAALYKKICRPLAISEHCCWEVKWRVEKWLDTAKKLAGCAPDEVICEAQNIVLDGGAEEMLKLITGSEGATAYDKTNAYIAVGDDSTAEEATQTGIKATSNKATAKMDGGYPQVDGRQMIFRASFDDDSANFDWHEICIYNAAEYGGKAMNRKVADLGTKKTGTWAVQVTVSLVSQLGS